jgi:hypothetical protein
MDIPHTPTPSAIAEAAFLQKGPLATHFTVSDFHGAGATSSVAVIAKAPGAPSYDPAPLYHLVFNGWQWTIPDTWDSLPVFACTQCFPAYRTLSLALDRRFPFGFPEKKRVSPPMKGVMHGTKVSVICLPHWRNERQYIAVSDFRGAFEASKATVFLLDLSVSQDGPFTWHPLHEVVFSRALRVWTPFDRLPTGEIKHVASVSSCLMYSLIIEALHRFAPEGFPSGYAKTA